MEKSKQHYFTWTIPLVGLVSFFVYFFIWANRSVSTRPPENAVQGAVTTISYKQLETSYFVVQVPSTLVVKNQSASPSSGVLLQQFLSSNTTTIDHPIADQIAITVRVQPPEGVSGLTDVQFRSKNPDTYQSYAGAEVPAGAVSFVNNSNGYEKSTFWCDRSRCLSLVVSGTIDRSQSLDEIIAKLLTSWQWK